MELAWWPGESSVTEAAGSLPPWDGLAGVSRSLAELAGGVMVGERACSGVGYGLSWDDLADGADSSGNAGLSTQLLTLAA